MRRRSRGFRIAPALAVAIAAGCVLPGGTLALGCNGADDVPVAALFEVPRDEPPPSGFYALPYPNDIRVGDDGRIDLSDHARPNEMVGLFVNIIADRQRGFSINAPSFFRFDAPIDDTSLPQTPEASLAADAPVYLVNVDPDSARRGERIPLRFRFEHWEGEAIERDWLSALPYPGFPLDDTTTYAVVVTDRVRATDGSAVRVAADFAIISSTEEPSEPALARAQQIYQPLWDWLDEAGGDERSDLVAASVFTTQDATALLGQVREVIWDDLAVPEPRDITWIADADGYGWFEGVYDGPNFQTGEVPYSRIEDGGEIILDEITGRPVLQRMEELRFSVSIPDGEIPETGWPIVLYAHGTGGSYESFHNDGTARRLAAEGLAVIGIDQVLHGPRNPGASPDISFFNFLNPLAARYNTLQGALDNFQLLRLVLTFDYTHPDPGGRTLRFDPDKIYFFGHSQGGLTGPPFLAHEPLVEGAVLSGAGGILYLSMLHKTEPVDIASLVAALIRDYPLDEFNAILALLQGWIDISDGVGYAPYLVRRPLSGVGSKHIYQSEGFTDRYTPLPNIEGLATAIGGNLVGPVIEPVEGLTLRERDTLTAPVTENLDGTTAVLVQYDESPGSDGHFVVFNVPAAEKQSARFLGTLAQTGTATLVEP